MINNNMEMLQGLDNIFNYKEYKEECEKQEIEVRDLQQYCLGIGMLMVARERYKELFWQEAYHKILQDINTQSTETVRQVSEISSKSKCCGGKTKKAPSLLKKGVNFTKAVTEHIITGKKHVADDVYMKRLDVCRRCPSRLEGFVCSECGCYMGIKASWADQKCELNKW